MKVKFEFKIYDTKIEALLGATASAKARNSAREFAHGIAEQAVDLAAPRITQFATLQTAETIGAALRPLGIEIGVKFDANGVAQISIDHGAVIEVTKITAHDNKGRILETEKTLRLPPLASLSAR